MAIHFESQLLPLKRAPWVCRISQQEDREKESGCRIPLAQ